MEGVAICAEPNVILHGIIVVYIHRLSGSFNPVVIGVELDHDRGRDSLISEPTAVTNNVIAFCLENECQSVGAIIVFCAKIDFGADLKALIEVDLLIAPDRSFLVSSKPGLVSPCGLPVLD